MQELAIPILAENKRLKINKATESLQEISKKLKEETAEVIEALGSGSLEEITSEVLDVIQVCTGVLKKMSDCGIIMEDEFEKHFNKLNKRGWVMFGAAKITIKTKEEILNEIQIYRHRD